MTEEKVTWLPNLVAGVSIWKLAVDLNEKKFFDGRLLVPETEGSDSLPIKVTWNVVGLLPLREARAAHPAEAEAAMHDFFACLEKVAAEFASEKDRRDECEQGRQRQQTPAKENHRHEAWQKQRQKN